VASESPIIINIRESIQKIFFRNSNIIKNNESIIYALISFFFATVTDRNSF